MTSACHCPIKKASMCCSLRKLQNETRASIWFAPQTRPARFPPAPCCRSKVMAALTLISSNWTGKPASARCVSSCGSSTCWCYNAHTDPENLPPTAFCCSPALGLWFQFFCTKLTSRGIFRSMKGFFFSCHFKSLSLAHNHW